MKLSTQKGNIILSVLIALVLVITGILIYSSLTKSRSETATLDSSSQKTLDSLKTYTSNDLKISFEYPKNWYVDEKDYSILVTSYKTTIGENLQPKNDEIKISIDNYSGCSPSLEEDLIKPACGQGKQENKILSKEVKNTPNGEFLKYILDSYDENQRIQYFFQKEDRILDIEKHPDPSQIETEFNQIVDSIRFLP